MTKSLIKGIKRHLWHKTYSGKRERFFKDFISPQVKIMPQVPLTSSILLGHIVEIIHIPMTEAEVGRWERGENAFRWNQNKIDYDQSPCSSIKTVKCYKNSMFVNYMGGNRLSSSSFPMPCLIKSHNLVWVLEECLYNRGILTQLVGKERQTRKLFCKCLILKSTLPYALARKETKCRLYCYDYHPASVCY